MEALARALTRRRPRYNALFGEARVRLPRLDAADFLDHLGRRVAPIVASLPEASADAEDRVLEALYRASLELLGRQIAGSHAPAALVNTVWEKLLPRLSGLLLAAPRQVIASMSNAAFNLAAEPRARPLEWIERMTAVADRCPDVDTLAAAGQIAAWRTGMAHLRAGAIALCQRSPEALTRALLDIPASAPADWLEQLAGNAFFGAGGGTSGIVEVGKLGGFRGYGGPFLAPPALGRAEDRIVAFDRESAWEIHADGFGALLRRTGMGQPPSAHGVTVTVDSKKARNADGAMALSSSGEVRCGGRSAKFPALAGASYAETQGRLLAVALPDSHYVVLLAAVGAPC